MTSFQPLNVTFYDYEPFFQYTPQRASSTGSSSSYWYLSSVINGAETGSPHYTSFAANNAVLFEWIGTAVWLYGIAEPSAYTISNENNVNLTVPAQPLGANGVRLLYGETGMDYGPHKIQLSVLGKSTVTIVSATVTVGVGPENAVLQNRTIQTVTNTTQSGTQSINPMFSQIPSNSWSVVIPTNAEVSVPYIITTLPEGALTFQVQSAAAFQLYGILVPDYSSMIVSVTLAPPQSGFTGTSIGGANLTYPDIRPNTLIWMQTGLNQSQTYTVMVNSSNPLSFQSMVLLDAVPTATSSTLPASHTASSSASPSGARDAVKSHSLSAGAIAGVTVAVVVLCTILVSYVLFRRKHRTPLDIIQQRHSAVSIEPKPESNLELLHRPPAYSDCTDRPGPDSSADPASSSGRYTQTYSTASLLPPGEGGPALCKPFQSSPLARHADDWLVCSIDTKGQADASRPLPSLPGTASGQASSSYSGDNPWTTAGSSQVGGATSVVDGSQLDDALMYEEDAGPLPMTQPPRYDPAWSPSPPHLPAADNGEP
ncbi:predicted protein [Postia placenta Mad-698-R]|uniref:Uncharacterized protein n=1 Tax=Postia placenta MAD-698-R-SB12 TaxID=670580 RepID=A0A1X6N5Y3_9APHY|nr:hypothetical protein POSPLADRAFT_1045066 [Postia placenta MAD-698-R-SB12]EED81236.1 predicted protein [Postia placenta Mad-698-R]OSX63896.1 hypothetical protein POSPLADRAFT_1045066 [Postia placenta MAD-698-R-SB12]